MKHPAPPNAKQPEDPYGAYDRIKQEQLLRRKAAAYDAIAAAFNECTDFNTLAWSVMLIIGEFNNV